MKQEYQCPICKKDFHYRSSMQKHKKTCGISKIDSFVENKEKQELNKLFNLNKAIKRNSYDVKKPKKSKQMTLKNKKV